MSKRKTLAAAAVSVVIGALFLLFNPSGASAHDIKPLTGECKSPTSIKAHGYAANFHNETRTVTVTGPGGVTGSTTVSSDGPFSVTVEGLEPQTGTASFSWTTDAVTPKGTPNFSVDFSSCQPEPEPCPYDENLTVDDEGCVPPPEPCPYDENLTVDDEGCVPPPPPDACPNLDGIQDEIIPGLELDENGNCVEPDVCPDVPGRQHVESECPVPQPPPQRQQQRQEQTVNIEHPILEVTPPSPPAPPAPAPPVRNVIPVTE